MVCSRNPSCLVELIIYSVLLRINFDMIASGAAAAAASSASGATPLNFQFMLDDLKVTLFVKAPPCISMSASARVHDPADDLSLVPCLPVVPVGGVNFVWSRVYDTFLTPSMHAALSFHNKTFAPAIVQAEFDRCVNGVVSTFLVYGASSGSFKDPLFGHLAEILFCPVVGKVFPALRSHALAFAAHHFPGMLVQSSGRSLDVPFGTMPRLVRLESGGGMCPSLGLGTSVDLADPGVATITVPSICRYTRVCGIADNRELYSTGGHALTSRRYGRSTCALGVDNCIVFGVGHIASIGTVAVSAYIDAGTPSVFWDAVGASRSGNHLSMPVGVAPVDCDGCAVSFSRALRWIDGFFYKHSVPVPVSTSRVPLWTRVLALCRDRAKATFVSINFRETPDEVQVWTARMRAGTWDPRLYVDCYTRITQNLSVLCATRVAVDKVVIPDGCSACDALMLRDAVRLKKDNLIVDTLFDMLPIEESIEFEHDVFAHHLWFTGVAQPRYRKAIRAIFHPINHRAFQLFGDRLRVFRRTYLVVVVLLLQLPRVHYTNRSGVLAFVRRVYASLVDWLCRSGLVWYATTCDRRLVVVAVVPYDFIVNPCGSFGDVPAQSFYSWASSLRGGAPDVYACAREGVASVCPLEELVPDSEWGGAGVEPVSDLFPDVTLCVAPDADRADESVIAVLDVQTVYSLLPSLASIPLSALEPRIVTGASGRKRKTSVSSLSGSKRHTSGVVPVVSAKRKRDARGDIDTGGLLDLEDALPKKSRANAPVIKVYICVGSGEVVSVDMCAVTHPSVRDTAFWRCLTDDDDIELVDCSPSEPRQLPPVECIDLMFFLCATTSDCILRSYLDLPVDGGCVEFVRRLHAQIWLGSDVAINAVAFAIAGQCRVDLLPCEVLQVLQKVAVYHDNSRLSVVRCTEWCIPVTSLRAFVVAPFRPVICEWAFSDGVLSVASSEWLVLSAAVDFYMSTKTSTRPMYMSAELASVSADGDAVMAHFFDGLERDASRPGAARDTRVLAALRPVFNIEVEDTSLGVLECMRTFYSRVVSREYLSRARWRSLCAIRQVATPGLLVEMEARHDSTLSNTFSALMFLPTPTKCMPLLNDCHSWGMARDGHLGRIDTNNFRLARVHHYLSGDLANYNYIMRQLFL